MDQCREFLVQFGSRRINVYTGYPPPQEKGKKQIIRARNQTETLANMPAKRKRKEGIPTEPSKSANENAGKYIIYLKNSWILIG